MPSAADLVLRYSGGAANTNQALSLGGALSTAAGGVIDDNVAGDLFDTVTGSQRAAGYTDYRAIYIRNEHATQTAYATVIWIAGPDNTELDMALATEAVNATIANTIASKTTAPTGAWLAAPFAHPASEGGGLAIGDIPAGQFKGIWLRRTIPAGSTSIPSDTAGISFAFDSD
jgi:hypothetical protein